MQLAITGTPFPVLKYGPGNDKFGIVFTRKKGHSVTIGSSPDVLLTVDSFEGQGPQRKAVLSVLDTFGERSSVSLVKGQKTEISTCLGPIQVTLGRKNQFRFAVPICTPIHRAETFQALRAARQYPFSDTGEQKILKTSGYPKGLRRMPT